MDFPFTLLEAETRLLSFLSNVTPPKAAYRTEKSDERPKCQRRGFWYCNGPDMLTEVVRQD